MFQTFGVKNVKVLDGGLPKWEKEGRKVEADADVGTEDDYKVSINHEIYRNYANIAEIEKEITDGKSDAQIVDARGEPMYAAGHIPVAKNTFFKKFQNDDGTIKKPEEVLKVLEDCGVDTTKTIVSSCGSGISGSYVYCAMKHAGLSKISLYDGSWSEYVILNLVSSSCLV